MTTTEITIPNSLIYLIWIDTDGGAHISRDDGRADQHTGNSLTTEQAVVRLSEAGVSYQLIEDVMGGDGR